jgi:ClpP class serine protease
LQKSKQDIEDIFNLFRDFVAKNRPQLDIDKVATGETWFGTAALDLNLCTFLLTLQYASKTPRYANGVADPMRLVLFAS